MEVAGLDYRIDRMYECTNMTYTRFCYTNPAIAPTHQAVSNVVRAAWLEHCMEDC